MSRTTARKRCGGSTAEPSRYDLVILDLMLPGIDGFGVVAELRRTRRYVPVLMLTARGRSEDVLRGFEMGADDYLTKPFELPILISRVRGLLRRTEWFRQQMAAETPPVPFAVCLSRQEHRLRADGSARRREADAA